MLPTIPDKTTSHYCIFSTDVSRKKTQAQEIMKTFVTGQLQASFTQQNKQDVSWQNCNFLRQSAIFALEDSYCFSEPKPLPPVQTVICIKSRSLKLNSLARIFWNAHCLRRKPLFVDQVTFQARYYPFWFSFSTQRNEFHLSAKIWSKNWFRQLWSSFGILHNISDKCLRRSSSAGSNF